MFGNSKRQVFVTVFQRKKENRLRLYTINAARNYKYAYLGLEIVFIFIRIALWLKD